MNLEVFLVALAIVESGDAEHPFGDDNAIGKHGERSRYQITQAAWNETGIGHDCKLTARSHPVSRSVAARITIRIMNAMPETINDAWWVAYAWNRGINGTLRDIKRQKTLRGPMDFATRVANTYDYLKVAADSGSGIQTEKSSK